VYNRYSGVLIPEVPGEGGGVNFKNKSDDPNETGHAINFNRLFVFNVH